MKVICAMLLTGEEVIAKLSLVEDKGLSYPHTKQVYSDIILTKIIQTKEGSNARMAPFSTINPAIELNQSQWERIILTELDVNPALEKIYLNATSKIQLV